MRPTPREEGKGGEKEAEAEEESAMQVKKVRRDQGAPQKQGEEVQTKRGATTRQAPRPASLKSQVLLQRGAMKRPAPRPASLTKAAQNCRRVT